MTKNFLWYSKHKDDRYLSRQWPTGKNKVQFQISNRQDRQIEEKAVKKLGYSARGRGLGKEKRQDKQVPGKNKDVAVFFLT